MNTISPLMNKDTWIETMEDILTKAASNKQIVSFIESFFQQKGYPITDVRPIVDGKAPLLAMDEMKRMTFSIALYNALIRHGEESLADEVRKISPEKVFTKRQMDLFADFHAPPRENRSRYPVTLEDVIKVNNREYTWVTTWGRFIKLFFDGIIEYDPKAQRELKQNDGRVFRATLYPDKIRRMRKLMLSGGFGDQPITINIEENSIFDFVHKYENFGELYIESGRIIFPDGNHRALAAADAISQNAEFASAKMTVMVKNFSDSRIKSHIAQINEQTPMEEVHAIMQETSLASNIIVDDLNNEPESALKGLIGEDGVIGEQVLKGLMSNYFDFIRYDNMGTRTRYVNLRRKAFALFNTLAADGALPPGEKLSNARGLLFCALLSHMEKHDWEGDFLENVLKNIDFSSVDAIAFHSVKLGTRSKYRGMIEEILRAAMDF